MKNIVFVQNYLTKSRFSGGVFLVFFILGLCFLFSHIYWNQIGSISLELVAAPKTIFTDNEYWRLLTTIFVHGDLKHLLSNSTMLLVMSYLVYSYFGIIIYPFVSLLMGAIVNYFVLLSFNSEISIVGISGVVYFLWGFWMILFMKIQTQVPLYRRFMKVLIVGSFFLIPEAFAPNVSYLAHFLGFVLGLVVGYIHFLTNRKKIRSHEQWMEVEEEEFDIDFKEEVSFN